MGRPLASSWSRSLRSARSFALASSITSNQPPAGRVAQKPLEADRIDEIGVRAELRQHETPLNSPPTPNAALFHVQSRRGVMDLRDHVVWPCIERSRKRRVVREPGRVVAPVMEYVPHDAQSRAVRELEHIGEAERAVVVLHHEPCARLVGKSLETPEEAVERCRVPPAEPPTWSTTTASGPRSIASSRAAWTSSSAAAAARIAGCSELRTVYWPGCVERRMSRSRTTLPSSASSSEHSST